MAGFSRNPYDKLGALFQGLVPALVAREILVRGMYVRGRKMVAFLVCCVALAISAMYELIEWWAALAIGQGARVRFSRHPGRPVGHAIRYVLRAAWRINDGDIPLARFHCRQLRRFGLITGCRFVDAGCGVNSLSGLQNLQIQSITLRRGLINISHGPFPLAIVHVRLSHHSLHRPEYQHEQAPGGTLRYLSSRWIWILRSVSPLRR